MASVLLPPTTTTTSPTNLALHARVFSRAFRDDAINRRLILDDKNLPAYTPIPDSTREDVFLDSIGRRMNKHHMPIELIEAGNGAGAAVWWPPGVREQEDKESRIGGKNEMLQEWDEKVGAIKKKALRGRDFWYLQILGRDPEKTDVKGAIRAVIDPYLAKAREQGVPAYLEASNTHARDVYLHLGFRGCVETVLMEGKCDVKGELVEGGEGIRIWPMIYEPEVDSELSDA